MKNEKYTAFFMVFCCIVITFLCIHGLVEITIYEINI